MSERKWTEKQLQAIENRNRTLLVSAAAGSGKTATLTERIIRSLTDEENPVSVDTLLVVTFTNAAAAELRAKISAALSEAVKKNPGNKALERQLFMLPQAKIRTIDSFCGDILRANADRVGVPFNYRIADTSECEIIAMSLLDGLIEAVYSGEAPEIASPEEFERLSDCLTDSKRTEELSDVFRVLYNKCESVEDGVMSIKRLAELYNTDNFDGFEAMPHVSYVMERARELAVHYRTVISDLAGQMPLDSDKAKAFYDTALSDLGAFSEIERAGSYTELRESVRSFSLIKRPAARGELADNDIIKTYIRARDGAKEDVKKIQPFFSYTEKEWRELYSSLYQMVLIIYRFVCAFHDAFVKEKVRRGALSYADVERFALECLVKDGERTDVAENLAKSYSAIYIDEYQDVNPLQNSVFEAISRPDNRFMVGDIKQSIYGFRSARPEIFAEMKRNFKPLCEADEGEAASVFMSNNFRCDRGVVDFVNNIFDKAFSLVGKSIGYLDEDRLIYSKNYDIEPEYTRPEICMLDKTLSDDDSDGEETDAKAPNVVAKKIKELISSATLADGRAVCPSDIAIILRNAKGRDREYAEALERLNIPVRISGAKSFFLSAEVLLALCLLNSIDNPRRDIYLAGLMCSPLYSFTPDEMYLIRKSSREGTLYDALLKYNEQNPDFKKGHNFVFELRKYRALSEGISCDELIFRLYHETGLLALASNSGGKENLMLLYDYSREFEAGEFRGLYNFIHFINSLIDKRTTFDDTRDTADTEAVHIVTCHSSKGLEYPIVFLVDTERGFSKQEQKERLSYSAEMGIAMRLRTPSGLAIVNNPVHNIINHYKLRKEFEEELRILYVALTRARERLFVVGTSPLLDREKYLEKVDFLHKTLSPYTMRSLSSFLEIILVTTARAPLCSSDFISCGEENSEEKKETEEPKREKETADTAELAEELVGRFGFKYERQHLTRLPEKMSVSKTSPTVLDSATEGVLDLTEDERSDGRTYLPKFISGSAIEESARRGIATHYFMQFCDLDRFFKEGAVAELSRLVDGGYISARDGERVRTGELEVFRKSELLRDMLSASALYRELRFNVRLPANLFTENEELRDALSDRGVLVQGVIDCVIEYDDGSIGVYDYKTDRLTAEELKDREKARKALISRHETQLRYYALAVEKMFGRAPKRLAIYSLHLGEEILVDGFEK